MLVRLLLALLVAALSLPAMAAPTCHAPPAATAMHHGPRHESPAKPVAMEMLCIGCVAPATARAPVLAPPLRFEVILSPPSIVAGRPLDPARPATPPPRSEA